MTTEDAARTRTRRPSVHAFVGRKIAELEGGMQTSDFAKKNGLHPVSVEAWKRGGACDLCTLKYIACKNNLDVAYFFPDGVVPDDYPTH